MAEIVLMNKDDIEICSKIYALAFDIICLSDKINTFSKENKELLELCAQTYNLPRYFTQCIDDKDKYAYCIREENQVIGFLTGWNMPSVLYPYSVYIDIIAVKPEYQKNGYGTKLLQCFLDNIVKDKSAVLVTKPDYPAYKMYTNIGFMDENETRMDYSEYTRIIKKVRSERVL